MFEPVSMPGDPMPKKVFIVSAVRTAIGNFGGALKSINAREIGCACNQGRHSSRSKLPQDAVGKVIFGNTLAPLNPNIARGAAVSAGDPTRHPLFQH